MEMYSWLSGYLPWNWTHVPRLLQTSWRPHIKWTEAYANELRQSINDFKVQGSEIENLNVLLIGYAGAGKSSFYNTCLTAVTNDKRIEKAFSAGKHGTSVTPRLNKTTIALKDQSAVRLNLFDCKGLHEGTSGILIDELHDVIEGKIPVGYEFKKADDDQRPQNAPNPNPKLQDKMQCIVLVIDASKGAETTEWYKSTIDELKRKYHYNKDIQMAILLTHVDRVRGSIDKDTTHVFRSSEVQEKVAEIALMFSVSEGDVLPMVNYSKEQKPTLEKDILALFNMLHIMRMANDYVKHIIPMEKPVVGSN